MTLPVLTYWPSIAKQRMVDIFNGILRDSLDVDDPTRVGIVSLGKYRDNPARAGSVIEVFENDPDDDAWVHHLVANTGNENTLGRYHEMVGGRSAYWFRRFTVHITLMMRGTTTADSDNIKGAIISRIEDLLLTDPSLGGLMDSAGERATIGRIVKERGSQSGDNTSPIWRHVLWMEFQTIRRR